MNTVETRPGGSRTRERERPSVEKKRPVCVASIMAAGILVVTSPFASAATCGALDTGCGTGQATATGAAPLGDTVSDSGPRAADTVEESAGRIGHTVKQVSGQAGDVVRDTDDAVRGVGEAAGDAATDPVGTVDRVTRPVTERADRTADPIKDLVDKTVERVNGTVDRVRGTVDEVLDPVAPVPPDPPKVPVPPGTSTSPQRTSGFVGAGARLEAPSRNVRPGAASSAPRRAAVRPAVPELAAPEAAQGPAARVALAASAQPGEASERSFPPPPDIVERLAFPLLLGALLIFFLLIQDRLDRNDPKLATAPVEGDNRLLRFQ